MGTFFKIAPTQDRTKYKLLEDYTVYVNFDVVSTENPGSITVRKGFEFDGASIPRFFWRMVTPFDPRVIRAAAVHDWLYDTHSLNKRDSDLMFRSWLLEDKLPKFLAEMMYRAVKYAGGYAWKN